MTSPTLIRDLNLSQSWLSILDEINSNKGTTELSPLVLTITDFTENENTRKVLDKHLYKNNKQSIETVSETIFPKSLYKLFLNDRHSFYQEYIGNFPRIKKLAGRKNNRGTYFQRLIDYNEENGNVNQIENIIESINGNSKIRRSKYQASIFDPNRDHITDAYQGFPCLQHLTFYVTKEKGLVLNSFYAIQHLYEKAYGNWLGLINLGKFVSEEIGIPFERFNCFVSIEKLDGLTKTKAKELYELAAKETKI